MVAGGNLPREGKEQGGGDDNNGFGVGGVVRGGARGGVGGWGGVNGSSGEEWSGSE